MVVCPRCAAAVDMHFVVGIAHSRSVAFSHASILQGLDQETVIQFRPGLLRLQASAVEYLS